MKTRLSGMAAVFSIFMILAGHSSAQISVPQGFVFDTLLGQIDGETPRLTATESADYGFGAIAASCNQGTLTVLKISQSNVELLATKSGFPDNTMAVDVKIDHTGLFSNRLYVSVIMDIVTGSDDDREHNEIYEVLPDGTINEKVSVGDNSDALAFRLAFTDGANGYAPGAYLEDGNFNDGTSYYHMDNGFNLTKLSQNLLPTGRSDLDVTGIHFDPTGVYNSYLTMSDLDPNNDNRSVIYQIKPDQSWVELTAPVRTDVHAFQDIAFSNGGDFGQKLYATDSATETIWVVETDQSLTEFASGFTDIVSIAIADSGEHMFVSDANGVYRIRKADTEVGPAIVMREPKVEDDDVHSGPSGVGSLRILWSEEIAFAQNDVLVENEKNEEVPVTVSGNMTQFMIIVFGEELLDDQYTITISDTVASVANGASIDGDGDGIAGGNAVIAMEHRSVIDGDFNGNGNVGLDDCASILRELTVGAD